MSEDPNQSDPAPGPPQEGESPDRSTPMTRNEEEAGETMIPKQILPKTVSSFAKGGTRVGVPSADSPEDGAAVSTARDRYSGLEEIARGGMGAIVKVVDNDIGRPVAMKVILGGSTGSSQDAGEGTGMTDDSVRIVRFVEEAQITGQLEHPNIVPVHELGRNHEGQVYFTMKLVKGESLEAILNRLADSTIASDPDLPDLPSLRPGLEDSSGGAEKRIPSKDQIRRSYTLSQLLQIYLKVCDAIAFAHAKGVIHRDLKPENVMVGKFGEGLVMDWGLSKVRGKPDLAAEDLIRTIRSEGGPAEPGEKKEGISHSTRTLEGDVFGTPSYMPPEQAAGNMEDVDERSDVFALGGILYKILTHEAPYTGASVAEVLRKAVRGTYASPRAKSPWNRIPPELESICLQAMHPKHERRYESVEALIGDVQAYQDHRPVTAHRYGPGARFIRFVQRHPVTSVSGGVALVLISLGLAVTGMLLTHAETIAARAETERLRAVKAERGKEKAEGVATTAKQTLGKGRTIASVLRATEARLGPVFRSLKKSFHSPMKVEEKQEIGDRVWPAVEAFEKTVAGDSASRATWLAVKGWLRLYAGYQEEAVALFRESREVDPDVAYGFLYEGLLWFLFYIN
ncbi:MAG: serine/threonine-protein kinase, partial [Planctomycetota bacterium]